MVHLRELAGIRLQLCGGFSPVTRGNAIIKFPISILESLNPRYCAGHVSEALMSLVHRALTDINQPKPRQTTCRIIGNALP
jgi:hypothetical protein